jgi:hypothetical protein
MSGGFVPAWQKTHGKRIRFDFSLDSLETHGAAIRS